MIRELILIKNDVHGYDIKVANDLIHLTKLGINSLPKTIVKSEFYQENKQVIPTERIARIKAIDYLLEILNNNSKYNEKIINKKELIQLYYMLKNYKINNGFVVGPSINFLESINSEKLLSKYNWYSKDPHEILLSFIPLDEKEKFVCGLPVLSSEYLSKKEEFTKKKALFK